MFFLRQNLKQIGRENFRFRNFTKLISSCFANCSKNTVSQNTKFKFGRNLQFRETRNQNLGKIFAMQQKIYFFSYKTTKNYLLLGHFVHEIYIDYDNFSFKAKKVLYSRLSEGSTVKTKYFQNNNQKFQNICKTCHIRSHLIGGGFVNFYHCSLSPLNKLLTPLHHNPELQNFRLWYIFFMRRKKRYLYSNYFFFLHCGTVPILAIPVGIIILFVMLGIRIMEHLLDPDPLVGEGSGSRS